MKKKFISAALAAAMLASGVAAYAADKGLYACYDAEGRLLEVQRADDMIPAEMELAARKNKPEGTASAKVYSLDEPGIPALAVDLTDYRIGAEGITNALQLGGYINKEGKKIKDGVLIRTGALAAGTEEDLKLLSEKYHVSDIVDLRSSLEIMGAPEPEVEGAAYRNISVWEEMITSRLAASGSSDGAASAMSKLAEMSKAERNVYLASHGSSPTPEMYRTSLTEAARKGFREFFDILLAKEDGKAVLWHCSQGKDRTGTASALILTALDFDMDTIMFDYLMTNECNAAIIANDDKEARELTDDENTLYNVSLMNGVDKPLLQSFFAECEKEYGSVMGYIKDGLGVTDAEIEQLKAKYLTD